MSRKCQRTFVILTDIRLIIDNSDGTNSVGTPLGPDAHRLWNLLVLLQVTPVRLLTSIDTIRGQVLLLSLVVVLLPETFCQQLLDLVARKDVQGSLDVRALGGPLDVWSVFL
jgi:hypothetical protein